MFFAFACKAQHFEIAIFSFFCTTFLEYGGIRSKKIFYTPSNSYYNSFICCYERKFFLFILLNKPQGDFTRGYLINWASCLFAFHQNRHQAVNKNLAGHDDARTNSHAAIIYFGQIFIFCRSISKLFSAS